MLAYVFAAVLAYFAALSLRSIWLVAGSSPWTALGWFAILAYAVLEGYEVLTARTLPAHLPYIFLGLLAALLIIGGLRDERQAQPWYWPRHAADRRRARP